VSGRLTALNRRFFYVYIDNSSVYVRIILLRLTGEAWNLQTDTYVAHTADGGFVF
jgi:hypothetical protein